MNQIFLPFKRWLAPPVFPNDEEKTAQARMMSTAGLYFIPVLIISAVFYIPMYATNKPAAWAIIVIVFAINSTGRYFIHRGNLTLAWLLSTTLLWLLYVALSIVSGGIFSPVLFGIVAMVVIIDIYHPTHIGMVIVVSSILIELVVTGMQLKGIVLPQLFPTSPMSTWLFFAMTLLFLLAMMNKFVGNLKESLQREHHFGQELTKTQKTLSESETRFRALSESSLASVYIIQEGRFLYVNPSLVNLFGYGPSELSGADPFVLIHPEDQDAVQKTLLALVINNENTARFDARCLRKNGETIYVEFLGSTAVLDDRPAIIGTIIDISERKKARLQIQKALLEKETLLNELYHRANNNMGLIIALLEMQASHIDDERLKTAFQAIINRIHSMKLVQQKLYQANDLSYINLKTYINDLIPLLMVSYSVSPGQILIIPEMEDVPVLVDTAIPCGLILNELISNSLKYAFPDEHPGIIRVELKKAISGDVNLCISDNGTGLPPGFDARRDAKLGLQSVFILAESQLRGNIRFSTDQGLTCKLSFKDDQYQPRV
jgi:PAS domain S-box-containing protein